MPSRPTTATWNPTPCEACLVQAADAISASRPGARRENIENYVKRLEKLEEVSKSFPGIASSYAIQAGREIRIMVKPEEVSEDQMVLLARDIAKKIEEELTYPGQIKVHVFRANQGRGLRKINYALLQPAFHLKKAGCFHFSLFSVLKQSVYAAVYIVRYAQILQSAILQQETAVSHFQSALQIVGHQQHTEAVAVLQTL